MRKERINEIWGVVFLLLGFFTIASLVFFNPEDIPFYASASETGFQNRTGVIGAYLAHGLTLSFGLASYLIPCLFLIWSWCFFNQRVPERKLFKFLGLAIGLIAAAVLLGISLYPERRFLRAGGVGYVLANQLLRYFGPVGSYVIAGACLLMAVLLATDFLIYPILKAFWKNLMAFFHSLAAWARQILEGFDELRVRLHRPKRERSSGPLTGLLKPTRSEEVFSLATSISEKIRREPSPSRRVEPEEAVETKIVEFKAKGIVRDVPKETRRENNKTRPVSSRVESSAPQQEGTYQLPTTDLLRRPEPTVAQQDDLKYNSSVVEETLAEFGIEAKVVEVEQGPVITRYELLPAPGEETAKEFRIDLREHEFEEGRVMVEPSQPRPGIPPVVKWRIRPRLPPPVRHLRPEPLERAQDARRQEEARRRGRPLSPTGQSQRQRRPAEQQPRRHPRDLGLLPLRR